MYTSLKLSKLLAENGCELESNATWNVTANKQVCLILDIEEHHIFLCDSFYDPHGKAAQYPAYDILNDLCLKYCKEVWGDSYFSCGTMVSPYVYRAQEVLRLLQWDETGKMAEDYIIKHCILLKESTKDLIEVQRGQVYEMT